MSKPKKDPPIYIRARCTQEFKDKVNKFADSKQLSESDVVRLAAQEYLERIEAEQVSKQVHAIAGRVIKSD